MTPFTFPIAVRDANLPVAEGQTFFDALRAIGLSCFELQVDLDGALPHLSIAGDSFNLSNDAGVATLQLRLQDEGASVAALLLNTDFSGSDAPAHTQNAIRMASVARALGVEAIRLDPMTPRRELSAQEVRDNTARCLQEILAQTESVEFGLENHGVIGNDPRFLDEVFAAVGDARLGMTLDTANFYWSGMPLSDVYKTLEHLAPRAKHTHIKNINYPADVRETQREADAGYAQYCAPLDEGDIALKRVVRILRDAGYTRALCIENEALPRFDFDEQIEVLRRDAAALRAAIESLTTESLATENLKERA